MTFTIFMYTTDSLSRQGVIHKDWTTCLWMMYDYWLQIYHHFHLLLVHCRKKVLWNFFHLSLILIINENNMQGKISLSKVLRELHDELRDAGHWVRDSHQDERRLYQKHKLVIASNNAPDYILSICHKWDQRLHQAKESNQPILFAIPEGKERSGNSNTKSQKLF